MVKIIQINTNKVLGYTDYVTYVSKNENNNEILEHTLDNGIPTGIKFNDIIYALEGRNGRPDSVEADITVRLENFNGGNNSFLQNEKNIGDLMTGLMETYEQGTGNTTEIEDLNNAVIELYEMITGEQ